MLNTIVALGQPTESLRLFKPICSMYAIIQSRVVPMLSLR